MGIEITVGQHEGDIIGSTHIALQAAVDYVAGLGGGVVTIGPGEYLMRDSVHLRSGVTLRGSGEATVLKKCDGVWTPLATDGDYGEEQITVVDPTGFKVGMGVTVGYQTPADFHVTVARITGRVDDNTFVLDRPLVNDYIAEKGARAQTTFPVISGYHVEGVRIENLAVDGNRANNPYLGGCRGGGVFLYRAHGAQIRGVLVRDYNGDGISYQQSDDVLVEDCTVINCADKGFHPGSGSQRTTIRRCRAIGNGQIGIFLCWRVRHSLFEENECDKNAVAGFSIGHKDTDNLFRKNVVRNNGRFGVLFRNETYALAGHRNRFEHNVIVNNGKDGKGYGVYIGGETEGVQLVENTIGNVPEGDEAGYQAVGVWIGEKAAQATLEGNKFPGVEFEVQHAAPASAS